MSVSQPHWAWSRPVSQRRIRLQVYSLGDGGAGRGPCTSAGCGVRAEGGLSRSKKQPKSMRALGEAAESRAGKAMGSLEGTQRLREWEG